EEQHHPDPGVDGTRRLPPAEQAGQEEQARMEHREAGECKQDEADRSDPVIDAGGSGVAIDDHRVAGMHLVARLDVVGSLARRSAICLARVSSSGLTFLAPFTKYSTKPMAVTAPTAASPAYLVTPFQSFTIGLICGSLGKPA